MTDFPKESIQAALTIIEGYEGIGGQRGSKFYPYHCAADGPGVMTLFKGHMLSAAELSKGVVINGSLIPVNEGITREQGEQLFHQDLAPRIKRLLDWIPKATPNQYAAALSFFYNNESAWGINGTPGNCHRQGYYDAAARAFFLYIKSGAPLRPRLGLWRRRGTEALYYRTGKLIIAKDPVKQHELFTELLRIGIIPKQPTKFY